MPTIAKVTTEALLLPPKSRALLADVLLDSLDDAEARNYDEIWLKEAKRRDREISKNNVACKTHEEVMKHARDIMQ